MSLVTNGEMTVKELVEKTSIIRTTIYEILENLIKIGLVTTAINNDGKKKFRVEDPIKLEEFVEDKAQKIHTQKLELEQQQKEIKELIPQLKTLSANIVGKPKVNFYEGAKGLVDALNDILVNKMPTKIYGSCEQWKRWMPDHYEWYLNEVKKRKIEIKQIEQKTIEDMRKINENSDDELWPKRHLPIGFNVPGFYVIYGDKVLIASFQKPMATMIQEKEYATTQNSLYDVMWQFMKD